MIRIKTDIFIPDSVNEPVQQPYFIFRHFDIRLSYSLDTNYYFFSNQAGYLISRGHNKQTCYTLIDFPTWHFSAFTSASKNTYAHEWYKRYEFP